MSHIPVCPECFSSAIQVNSTRGLRENDDGYRCKQCEATFDDPAARESRKSSDVTGLDGLARKLDALDPDSIGRDR